MTTPTLPNPFINAKAGVSFTVYLSSHGGTGYSWHLTQMPDNLILLGCTSAAVPPVFPGGFVNTIFTFVGEKPGKGNLGFALIRPWDPLHSADTRTFIVTITAAATDAQDLAADIGGGQFLAGSSATVHQHPVPPYGTTVDEKGHPKVIPLYGFPIPDGAGGKGPCIVATLDAAKCVVKYGTPQGVSMDPTNCHLKYGFPVGGGDTPITAMYMVEPILKYGFPQTVAEHANCVVKYGTPNGVTTDPAKCNLKYGMPVPPKECK